MADHVYQDYKLPSNGLPYGDKIPMGIVSIRPMTGAEEAILNTPTLSGPAKMNRIVEACTRFPSLGGGRVFSTTDLITTDRMMLLFGIRTLSFGDAYQLETTCDTCGAKYTSKVSLQESIDIEELPRKHNVTDDNGVTRSITRDYDDVEGISCILPKIGTPVRLRLLTVKDEDFMAREVERATKSPFSTREVPGDRAHYLRVVLSILSIDGKPFNRGNPSEFTDVVKWLSGLPIVDSQHLQLTYNDHDVQLTNDVSTLCQCGSENTSSVSLTTNFFRTADR